MTVFFPFKIAVVIKAMIRNKSRITIKKVYQIILFNITSFSIYVATKKISFSSIIVKAR